MTIRVHTISGSPRGWRVLIGLALKGLSYETRLLQLSADEHKSPGFLALNPRGTVPVIEADGVVLRDSMAALAWLDRQFPEPPLFGEDALQAAVIWQVALECCDYLREASRRLLAPVLLASRPLPKGGSAERQEFEAAAEALHAECRWLERLLEDRRFAAGDTPSAADAVTFPEFCILQRAAETRADVMDALGFADMASLYPHTEAWKNRFLALPGIATTWPPHWQADQPHRTRRPQ